MMIVGIIISFLSMLKSYESVYLQKQKIFTPTLQLPMYSLNSINDT